MSRNLHVPKAGKKFRADSDRIASIRHREASEAGEPTQAREVFALRIVGSRGLPVSSADSVRADIDAVRCHEGPQCFAR